MANEAVIIELLGNAGDPIRYTVADGAALTKGAIMKVTDPRTAAVSSAADEPIIGVLAHDKVASDGATTASVYTNGIFDAVNATSGATVGAIQGINGANTFQDADASDLIQGSTVGQALETGGTPETIAIRILK